MKKMSNVKKGFTLVEIIVVIAIIGILASFLVGAFTGIKRTTRDAQRKTDLRSIQSALEIYRSDKGDYPSPDPSNPFDPCGGSWTVDGTVYIQKIPCDPLGGAYTYSYPVVAGGYELIACLEDLSDKQKDATNNITYCNGTAKWSYTLKNP